MTERVVMSYTITKPLRGVPGTFSGLGQRWRHLDKSSWVWLLAIALLLLLVVNPLLRLLIVSFQDASGAFTLANYVAAYSRARQLEALGNSLLLGVSAATLCVAF